jgi:hypothetical protein
MIVYIIDYNEDIVEPIQIADGRYYPEDIREMYGEFFVTFNEAKAALDEHAKGA